MIQPDFHAMTKAELRNHVVNHPDDQFAFQVFVDRFTADAAPETFDLPNSNAELAAVDRLIRQKLETLQ